MRKNFRRWRHEPFTVMLVIIVGLVLTVEGRGFVKISGGGYVTAVLSHAKKKDLFYAKTDVGGVFRWQPKSCAWEPLFGWVSSDETSYLGVEALALDPQSPNRLYALVGTSYWNRGKTAILRSDDYGESFHVVDVTTQFKANGNGSDRQKGEALAVDPNNGNILFCGSRYNNGLFRSADAGVTWSVVSSFNKVAHIDASISFVAFDPKSGSGNSRRGRGSQTIYAGVFRSGENLYVSHDGGKTWDVMRGSYTGGKPNRCWVYNDSFKTMLHITYQSVSGGDGAVMRYTESTGKWESITPVPGRSYSGICVDRDDPKKIIVSTYNQWSNRQKWGGADYVFYSEDGGRTWSEKLNEKNASMDNNGVPWLRAAVHWIGCVTFDPFDSSKVFAVSGNGIFHATDITPDSGKIEWKFMSEGLEEIVMDDAISIPGGPLITSVKDQGGFVHTDVDEAPSIRISNSAGFGYATQAPGRIIRTDHQGLLLSVDNGLNWTRLGDNPAGLVKGTVAMSADGEVILWKLRDKGEDRCYRSEDVGKTWALVESGAFDFIPMADPVDKEKFYGYNLKDGFMYVSRDGGLSFEKKGSAGTGGHHRIAIAPGVEGHLWIAQGNRGISCSTDAGETFQNIPVANCTAISIGKASPRATYPTVFMYGKPANADAMGIYRSLDRGMTWDRVDDNEHQYGHLANAGMILADQNIFGRVYRSTAGIGIPYYDSPDIPGAAH